MLKTNSKEVMNRIKKIIMDSYEAAEEYYTYEGATMKTEYNEICKDILNMFYIEKLHLDNRYKPDVLANQIYLWTGCKDSQRLSR